jgi:hypothetical protein
MALHADADAKLRPWTPQDMHGVKEFVRSTTNGAAKAVIQLQCEVRVLPIS